MKLKVATTFLLLLSLFVPASISTRAAAYSSQATDDGGVTRLRWKNGVIPIAVSTSLINSNANIKSDGDGALAAVRRSLESWEKVANVKFEIVSTDKQSASQAGKFGDGVNLITIAQTPENLLLFNGGDDEEIAARTRSFFSAKGFIAEADIVLNPYEQFSTDGSIGTFDLEATLTHEIGHLLGLGHSTISGATMFERQGKNGVYGLPNYAARTLAADDISGIRAVYGAKNSSDECCGAITGKIFGADGKAAKDVQVWAEQTETGSVAAAVLTGTNGSFRIEGLSAGRFSIYAQEPAGKKMNVAAQPLGTVEVGANKFVNITRKLKNTRKTFDLNFAGFNSQISDLAVLINGGKSFVIYVGGKNLDAENLIVGFNSPFFSVTPNTLIKQDFGAQLSVLSFEVKVDAQAANGEYSFFLRSKNGETAYLVGALNVENFVNPWSVYTLSADE